MREPANLDGSWKLALHMAARSGVDWGSALQFTYGPLGFLGQPRWAFGTTTALAMAATLLGRTVLAATVVAMLRERLPGGWAAGAALAVSFLVRVEVVEVLAIVVAVWCLRLLLRPDRVPRFAVEAGAAVGVVVLLMKFNVGVVALGVVAVTALALQPPMRAAARLVAAASVTLLVCWVGTGNPLAALPAYVRGSVEVAGGYTAAMGIEAAPGWHYAVAGAVAALVLTVAVASTARPFSRPAVAVVAVVLLVLFAKYKHAFVRHDDAHVANLFVAAALLPLGLAGGRRPRAVAFAGVVCAASLALVSHGFYDVSDLAAAGRLATQAADVAVPSRRAALDRDVRALNDEFHGVDPLLLNVIGDAGVHVDPWETSAVWAYDLSWRPVPVFQLYSAYTPYLDERNAAALRTAGGPRFVLRRVRYLGIDRREPLYDSPAYQLDVVCGFREVARSGRWQLLERGANRCGPPVELSSATVAAGDAVAVPDPADAASLVVARFEAPVPLARRLLDVVHKSEPFRVEVNGAPRRLVLANAGGPHLLRSSPADPALPQSSFRDVRSIRFLSPRLAYRVTFYEVPFAADVPMRAR